MKGEKENMCCAVVPMPETSTIERGLKKMIKNDISIVIPITTIVIAIAIFTAENSLL